MNICQPKWVGILLLVTASLGSKLAWAQKVDNLTDEQVRQFVTQAQASGMTEAQMEELARSRNFTSADIASLRKRIGQSQPTRVKSEAEPVGTIVREQPATPAPPTAPSQLSTNSLVFGASLFANASLSFEPNLRMPTPRNYIIGPEDELIIDIYGNAQQTYRPKVSPEGSIRIENLSPIYVNGLTIDQAEQRIVNRLRTLYQGVNTAGSGIQAQLTLGSVRSIKVTLLGQVVRPGTYTLSSLATVFNALYAAGGPSPDRGSFRDIRVYRANRLVRTLDVYDFLLRADQKDNIRLQDQDIVYIDHYETRIELTGEVKQPGFYEVRKGETLQQVLKYAGGFADQAYTARLNLYRHTATEQQLSTISADDFSQILPQTGDRYVVSALLNRVNNKVSIEGAVFRPGEYALSKNSTLKQLLTSAEGLREDAFLRRATIRRLRDNLDPELISVDLKQLLRNETPDVVLQHNDVVQIKTVSELRQKRTVSIQGAVNQAGTFEFVDSMTVANLIVLAGGLSDAAIASRLEIARRVKNDTTGLADGQNVRLITFSIDQHLRLRSEDAHLILQPFDQVFVRESPRYEPQKGATLSGEVLYPGTYAIQTKRDRISDLISRAGGLKQGAYLPAARFVRKGETVTVDLRSILNNPRVVGNLLLEDGDILTVPRRSELVRIRGEVVNPATVEFDPTRSFSDYINEAGGFTPKASTRKVYAIAANGKIKLTRSFLGLKHYPAPERGMEIIVPAQPQKEQTHTSTTERAALLSVIASGTAVVLTALRLFTN